jgi:hypothetical protein
MDHCFPELVVSCYRYGNTLSKLSDHHSTCVIAWVDVEPIRNLPAYQLKPKSEVRDRGESDPFMWKDGGSLFPRADRGIV